MAICLVKLLLYNCYTVIKSKEDCSYLFGEVTPVQLLPSPEETVATLMGTVNNSNICRFIPLQHFILTPPPQYNFLNETLMAKGHGMSVVCNAMLCIHGYSQQNMLISGGLESLHTHQ